MGLPVTMPGVYPAMEPYASIIHAIVCELVPISGAGMSRFTPSRCSMLVVYRRVMWFSSASLIVLGSHWIPPLPPPKGMLTTAVFQVISDASARISLMSACGWYRVPPLYGPRAALCWIR